MSNQIQPFDFNGIQVRVLTDEHGNPWFLGADVCAILGTATNHIREYLDADEITNIRSTDIAQNGGKAPVFVSESDTSHSAPSLVRTGHTTCNTSKGNPMKITTPNGTLEGESIETILKQYGLDCLRGADLRYADLNGADLSRADLFRANLCDADLCGADLFRANLCCADLFRADLRCADLRGADPCGAGLSGLTVAQTSILPDEGDIIGWKKAYVDDVTPVIVKLLIPADAQRSNSTGRKCRASKAQVPDLQDKQGNSLPPDSTAHSSYDPDFTYKKGETMHVEDFDTNRWNECAPGIHFFITRIEAAEY